MEVCSKNICTACSACMNICPKDAITMLEDNSGFVFPVIDSSTCISCRACQNVCPNRSNVDFCIPEKAYAVWSRQDSDLHLSASGGAGAVFSRYVINNGGIVYGAAFEEGAVKHIEAKTINEIDKLRGSKYTLSNIGYVFRSVKQNLLKGLPVLFIGTPCQIAGLKNYLTKDYEHLILIDLVCHGIPPYRYLKQHLVNICGQMDLKQCEVSFRNAGGGYELSVKSDNNVIYQNDRYHDEYLESFLRGITLRENCYSCLYSRAERVSDLTIGDFWGLDRSTLKKAYDGKISLVLQNTEKGSKFFQKVMPFLNYEERSVSEATNTHNRNLLHPTPKSQDREEFLLNVDKMEFDTAVHLTKTWQQIKKYNRRSRLKTQLKDNVPKVYSFFKESKEYCKKIVRMFAKQK